MEAMKKKDVQVFITSFDSIKIIDENNLFLIWKLSNISLFELIDECPIDHFQCSNQRCVPDTVVCNGENDCGDHTDESEGCLGKNMMPMKQRNIRVYRYYQIASKKRIR